MLEDIELDFGSEFPTHRNPDRAALVAREAAKAHSVRGGPSGRERGESARSVPAGKVGSRSPESGPRVGEGEPWCDSEAPTGVAAERPLLPRPPRPPRV